MLADSMPTRHCLEAQVAFHIILAVSLVKTSVMHFIVYVGDQLLPWQVVVEKNHRIWLQRQHPANIGHAAS